MERGDEEAEENETIIYDFKENRVRIREREEWDMKKDTLE